MTSYPVPLVSGFILAAASMPLLIALARRLGMVDNPAHRKTHSQPTPYLGGLGIMLGFVLGPGIYYYFFNEYATPDDWTRYAVIIGPALAAGLLGVCDDKRPIRAKLKLLTQLAIVLAFTIFGFRIELIEVPGIRGYYGLFEFESIPITIGWMLAVINGINLVDGVDGLAGSVMALIFMAIAFMAISLDEPDWLVAVIAISALGATLGFLVFNWRPAKIYMGDAGSLAGGTLIATLLVALGQRTLGGSVSGKYGETLIKPYSYQLVKMSLIAFYPLMEIGLSILRRTLSGKPIGSADKGHVHHRLVLWGWTAPQVCAAAAGICAIAGATVIFAQLQYRGVASGLLLAGGVLFVLLLNACGFLELLHPKSIKGNRPYFLIANHFVSMQLIKLNLARNLNEIAALAEQTCIEFGVEQYSMKLRARGNIEPGWSMDWKKPPSAHGSFLLAADPIGNPTPLVSFSDKVTLPSSAAAEWTFEPHAVEEEIDVEYRVLMSDFMRKALECAEKLDRKNAAVTPPAVGGIPSADSVRSSELRRRRASEKVPSSRPPTNTHVKKPSDVPER